MSGLSKRLRFEVFKRDGFTCQYCGKKTPEVVLEVDHIVSRHDGGQDEMTNLVTACFDCNRGKGKISLDEIPTQEEDLHEKTILLLERERQIREYNQVWKEIKKRQDDELEEINKIWLEHTGYELNQLQKSSLRQFMKIFISSQIIEAIEIAASKKLGNDKVYTFFKYVCGILHNWRKKQDGQE